MRLLMALALSSVVFPQTNAPLAAIVTSDIESFWKAYDAGTPGNRADAFQRLYLDPASPGLQDFVESRIGSASKLAAAVDQRYPKFYASVRPYTLGVDKQRPAIQKYLARYLELYSQADFPPVYFVIGRLTSGGTVSRRGLLIGTEVNSLGENADTSEIAPSFRAAMGTAERIPLIVIHELTHTQAQKGDQGKTPPMLAQCIGEGAADFITELVADSSINAHMKDWADARREELFQRFARDMKETPKDAGKWLYNYSRVRDEPADLGYWIGAEICRSFYNRAEDKAKAVRKVVTLKNIDEIVQNSQYAWLLEK